MNAVLQRLTLKINQLGSRKQVDLAYFLGGAFWVYVRQAVMLAGGLATSVAFTRLAPKEVYGQYSFLLAVLAIASLASIPGLNTAVLRSAARGNDGDYQEAVKTSLRWSLLAAPVLLGLGAYYYYYQSQATGICLMISSLLAPLMWAPNTWDFFLQGKQRFDLMTRYASLLYSLSAALTVAAILLAADNLVLIFTAYLAANGLLNWLLYRSSLKHVANTARDSECRKYGFFLTSTNIVGTIANNVDKILLGILLGPAQLAIYAIATGIPVRLKDLLRLGGTPLTPRVSRDGVEMRHVLQKVRGFLLPLALIGTGGALLYWFFIDDLMLLLFGAGYQESGGYARLLLPMVLLALPNAFLGTFAMMKKRTGAIVLGYHVFPFLKLAIMSGFIYQWGIAGAIWGLNLSVALQGALTWLGMKGKPEGKGR